MRGRQEREPGRGKILETWEAPAEAGEPVGCLATSYTFSAVFFETECLARFVGLESDAEDDRLKFVIEQETRMAQLEAAGVLVDQEHCAGQRSLRWDLLPARLRGRRMHAKVALLCWERQIRLIVSSANLTEDGYRRNQEVFGVLDYREEGEAPLEALAGVSRFLRDLGRESVVDGAGSPALARWNRLLDRIEQTPKSWGLRVDAARKTGIRVSEVLSGLGQPDVLTQFVGLWPEPSPPGAAWVVSPFFDPGKEPDAPTRAMWEKLRRRGEARVRFCVSAEEIPGSAKILVAAPGSLLKSQPRRPTVRTEFVRIKDNRPLHTKAIWLEGERYALYLIGSSNFTTGGLNLGGKGNVEANLAYLADYRQHEKEARALEVCFPEYEAIGLEQIQWPEAIQAEEEAPAEVCPLPESFGRAVFDASIAPHGRLTLRILGGAEEGWELISEDKQRVLSEREWEARGGAQEVALDWEWERPPSGLWVLWGKGGARAWWPVEVESPGALPPPSELRELPLEVLIRVLTSARPLHQKLALELRLRSETAARRVELQWVTDPHKKVDVSGFLLQRSRRVSEAIQALCERLGKPAASEACLHWRLFGPVGAKVLAAALERESKSEEERAFLLTELALGLARVQARSAPGGVPAEEVRERIHEVVREIRERVPCGELEQVPNLARYVEQAWKGIAR